MIRDSSAMLLIKTFQGNSMTALTLNLAPITHLTHEQFRELCQANPELKLERTAEGELIVMPPTGWESGKRNSSLTGQLWAWNEQTGFGIAFDSSTGFALPKRCCPFSRCSLGETRSTGQAQS